MPKLVILDRDGVINFDSAQFIKSPAEWKPIPGSLEAIARLNQNGYKVVVATNQSGIGRGFLDMDTLNAIHEKMHKALFAAGGRIEAIFFCPHTAEAKCACRKPQPGNVQAHLGNAQCRSGRRAGDRRFPARPAGRRRGWLPPDAGPYRQG